MTQADFTSIPPVEDPLSPPTPDQIDLVIADYEVAQKVARDADKQLSDAKSRLVWVVDRFGQVPAHAEQSRRIAGRHNVATVTRGTTITVHEPGVLALFTFLAEKGFGDLFSRFFQAQTKHVLVEGARDVLKTVTLPRRVEEKIAALFGKAFDVKPRAATVKVELINPEKPAKQPRGGKKAA